MADPANFYGVVPNFKVAVFATGFCDPDNRRGREIAGAGSRWYLGDNDAPLNKHRFKTIGDRAAFAESAQFGDDALVESGIVVGGDPDSCCRVIERWQQAGVDELLLMIRTGHTTHEQTLRAIELFGEQVLPRFQDRPASAAVLAGREARLGGGGA